MLTTYSDKNILTLFIQVKNKELQMFSLKASPPLDLSPLSEGTTVSQQSSQESQEQVKTRLVFQPSKSQES